jgi:hypothetical protein
MSLKIFTKPLLPLLFLLTILGGCMNNRRLITDEIVTKDQNSQTGTIIKADSSRIILRKFDESQSVISWSDVDTVIGKKYKTVWLGANLGYHNVPYFSVFRNQAMTGRSLGFQYKIGMAYRGNKLYYLQLGYFPASPYQITKFGFGYKYYLGQTTYLGKNSFFVGGELNLMNAKYNNGAQTTLEPFTGYEQRLSAHVRMHIKLGLQFNIANKNSNAGINLSVGFHFMRKNFKKRYEYLNQKHRLYGE